jgi:hypothetical protein
MHKSCPIYRTISSKDLPHSKRLGNGRDPSFDRRWRYNSCNTNIVERSTSFFLGEFCLCFVTLPVHTRKVAEYRYVMEEANVTLAYICVPRLRVMTNAQPPIYIDHSFLSSDRKLCPTLFSSYSHPFLDSDPGLVVPLILLSIFLTLLFTCALLKTPLASFYITSR